MCGITGFVDLKKTLSRAIIAKMTDSIVHRGPDQSDIYWNQNDFANIALGHRRLSILDLSEAGRQPMKYKHFVVVYNGEIYNFKEIRSKLQQKGHSFKSDSDTEVILHAFDEYGYQCVDHFIGMFAISIYDSEKEEVTLFRDRVGVKPLFYLISDKGLVFGSELKTIMNSSLSDKEISQESLYYYFNYGYVPTPLSIYNDVKKLVPGTYLVYKIKSQTISKTQYWNSTDYYQLPKLDISYSEAKSKVRDLLSSSYNYRMVSDVPVGVFLSGGYDSVSVAALLTQDKTSDISTFTIGFNSKKDEAPAARMISKHLGTKHHEMYCTEKEAKEIIPTIPKFCDEPFGDSSIIPTTLLSRFAKKHVKVALSADGGDELFVGYNRYPKLVKNLSTLKQVPSIFRSPISASLNVITKLFDSNSSFSYKLKGVQDSLHYDDLEMAARLYHNLHLLPSHLRKQTFAKQLIYNNSPFNINGKKYTDVLDMTSDIDIKSYLQNDILVKVDRATMSTSLEGRDPMIDHRIIELAAQLPSQYKYNKGITKYILKDIVHDMVPKSLMDRPKTGFSLPIYSWLKEDLSFYLDLYLSKEALKLSGLFNVDFTHSQVELFRHGKLHYKPFIWRLLMFQMWFMYWHNEEV